MGRYGKVLVAVDGSDAGANALRQACRINGSDPCPVTVVTAYPHLGDTEVEVITPREDISAALRAEALKLLDQVKKTAGDEGLAVGWMKAVEGSPFEVIVDTALQGRFDLIVMGRRGLNRFERALMGSVTARVIGHAETDILVVPRDATLSWARILVPTDGSRHSRAAVEKAIALARAYGARLDLVSVVDAADEFQFAETPGNLRELLAVQARKAVAEAKALAVAGAVAAESFVTEGRAHDAIASLARERETTVVVIGSHGRSGLRRLLMGSVAEKVIGAVSCPVLVARL